MACCLPAAVPRGACAQGGPVQAQQQPVPLSPADGTVLAYRDALKLTPGLAKYTRWLWAAHLPVKERQEWWQVLSGHVNGLSREALIVRPIILLADGSEREGLTLEGGAQVPPAIKPEEWDRVVAFRINGLAYDETGKFFLKAWEKLPSPHFLTLLKKEVIVVKPGTQSYGYFVRKSDNRPVTTTWAAGQSDASLRWVETSVVPVETKVKKVDFVTTTAPWLPPKEAAALIVLTDSQVPVVYADWFFYQSGIQVDRAPAGYADFLGFKDEQEFQNLVGFDKKLFEKKFKNFLLEIREAVARSGVSAQPRRIARFEKLGGGYWQTFDNKLAVNKLVDGKVQFRNPLNTPGDEFQFDASEVFAHLPNGIWGLGLFDNKGVRQDSAPDFVGFNHATTGNDGRIHLGPIGCYGCHVNGGLNDIRGWYRRMFRPPVALTSPDYKRILEAQRLYFRRLEPLLKTDRDRFETAILEATGLTSKKYSVALRARWQEVADAGVALARAARELGATKGEFVAAVKAFLTNPFTGDLILAAYIRPEDDIDPLPVDQWFEVYPAAQLALFAHRQIIRQGYRPPNLESPECKKWATNHGGKFPAYEKGGKFVSWAEACKAAGVETAGWPLPAVARREGE